MIRCVALVIAQTVAACLLFAAAAPFAQEEDVGGTQPAVPASGPVAAPVGAGSDTDADEYEDEDEESDAGADAADAAAPDDAGTSTASDDATGVEDAAAVEGEGGTEPFDAGAAAAATHARRGPKKQVYGWIEDVLIDPAHALKLPAKLDTGADTTSLDARNIRRARRDGEDYVRFIVTEPVSGQTVELEKPFVRAVRIKAHGSATARRVVVRMRICIGDRSRSVEVNLVDRAHYEYPLLLGRNALRDVAMIDPNLRRTREPSCWNVAEPWAAAPPPAPKESSGRAPTTCENAPMC
jgi:hypothetical protein